MTEDDIDEAIDVLARAWNVELRQSVIQTLRKLVNSGGESLFQQATKRCDMGVGCDEAGVCYAEAHGAPDRCSKAENRDEKAASLANSDWRNLYDMVYGHECTFKSFMATIDDLAPRHASEDVRDAERFRWLTEDHADAEVRAQCRSIIESMGVRSYSATCRDIDAAIKSSNTGRQDD